MKMKLLFALVLCLFASASADFEEVEQLLQKMYPSVELKMACTAFLGKGSFGEVYACMVPDDTQDASVLVERAVKVIALGARASPAAVQKECENAQRAKKVLHGADFVLTCYKMKMISARKAVMIMDYVPNAKDLNSVVKEVWHNFRQASDKGVAAANIVRTALNIWGLVADVLSHLISGEVKYVHGDIKPANILYDSTTSKIYLIDFGEFRVCDETGGFTMTQAYSDGSSSDTDKCGAYDIYSATSVPLAFLLDGSGPLKNIRTYLDEHPTDIKTLVQALASRTTGEESNQLIKSEFKSVMRNGAAVVKEWVSQEITIPAVADRIARTYGGKGSEVLYATQAIVYRLTTMKENTAEEIKDIVMQKAFEAFDAEWKQIEQEYDEQEKAKKEEEEQTTTESEDQSTTSLAQKVEAFSWEEPSARPKRPVWEAESLTTGYAVDDALKGYPTDFEQSLGRDVLEGYFSAILAQVDSMKLKMYKLLYASLAPRTVRLVATDLKPLIVKLIRKFESAKQLHK